MTLIPIAKVIPDEMVEVVAPSDLKEGYQFEAHYNGVAFSVTVPLGGVVKGQRILVPVKASEYYDSIDDDVLIHADSVAESAPLAGSTISSNSYGVNDIIIDGGTNNHGRWRAGFLDCLELGPLHPTLCNSIFCPLILLGQVLTRMKLNMFALPVNDNRKTFKNVVTLLIVYWILTTVFAADPDDIFDKHGNIVESPKTMRGIINGSLIFWFRVYCVYLMIKLRMIVREKYQINGGNLIKDLFLSFFCSICTVSQLARETAEYYDNNAMWCSNSGLKEQYQPETV